MGGGPVSAGMKEKCTEKDKPAQSAKRQGLSKH